MSEEIWKDIPGYEKIYQVSSLGRVRKLTPPMIMKSRPNSRDGRPQIRLAVEASRRTFKVHTLVLLAFKGPKPDKHEAAHLDGEKTNNRVENLEWTTHKENVAHTKIHGTIAIGSRNGNAKLNEEAVKKIKAIGAAKSCREIADAFGVTHTAVEDILRGKTWRHVE